MPFFNSLPWSLMATREEETSTANRKVWSVTAELKSVYLAVRSESVYNSKVLVSSFLT